MGEQTEGGGEGRREGSEGETAVQNNTIYFLNVSFQPVLLKGGLSRPMKC